MNREILTETVLKSTSISDVSKKLYGNINCGNRNTIKKFIKLFNLDTSHFSFISKQTNKIQNFIKIPIREILINPSFFNSTNLKHRLYEEGLKQPICELCGQTELWNGKHMSLVLDHKNGIHSDCTFENLQIVCPNCNATLETFGGKNAGRSKKQSKQSADKKLNVDSLRSINMRRAVRPPIEELLLDIKLLGYVGTGIKYNVSDNAIRKWVKYYEKYN
jgi:hypothetical protein